MYKDMIRKEYSVKILSRKNGCDSLIDLGSGSGDVLMDFVYPIMPKNFQRLVCSDIIHKMVNYAKSTNMRAVNPFLVRIPDSLHDEYMNDVMSMILEGLHWPNVSAEYRYKFPSPYKLLVAYGRK
ncbi:juvenile hormone acid O-methyltransferase-like [Stomoxys calcitrans]|uniref:juvenile hormone acid O-methyltransferase-like n=1 Tax=Stomoxys calcitrans TaxID=35570 RepID=UPI0027E2DE0F|nr:juvenile hormone acid O-methyltransferase-like [Stomoxys calcitrans]